MSETKALLSEYTLPYPIVIYEIDTPPETFPIFVNPYPTPLPYVIYKVNTPSETFPNFVYHVEKIPALPYYTPPIIHHTDTLPGNRSFRTQVISYILVISYPLLFSIGHFIPGLVISYPVWSFHTYFYYFLENRFGHLVPIFYCFVPKSFRTWSHFEPILVISYPSQFVPGRNKTRNQSPRPETKIRDQILSAENCYQTCM